MTPFKAYDIRGEFGTEVTPDLVYRIGRCLTRVVPAGRAVVGRDARVSSPVLRDALVEGLLESGCAVDDMGLASTPMVYFATARKGYDLSVQITASHNPANCNGLKISRAGAFPVGGDSGLAELERLVRAGTLPSPAARPAGLSQVDFRPDFLAFLRGWLPDLSGLKIVVDCSDGMGSLTARDLFADADATFLADTPDGTFPSHPPNPFEAAGRAPAVETVRRIGADVAILFDGDADRMMVLDERGDFVRPDLMIAVMAQRFLRESPGATILQDIRTSRGVTEAIEEVGAVSAIWKVGHANAKRKMRELGAVFGGELAGHYYFRDFFWCDSGELAALVALGEIAAAHRRGVPLSALVKPFDRYANSGELNYTVSDKDAAIEAVRRDALSCGAPLRTLDFDGYRIEFAGWWISVRQSNTEPYVRLLLEAATPDLLAERRAAAERALAPFLAEAEA
ncbi:MAG: phosphomannomutase/phosphoglucomutase [Kiritimatiellia bacterium]|jgi:phosphomannomutase